ncbi:MAG: cytochrome P450 [Novosphingobium sp.]|nr:cytochrome P450 [Novosphingobium sp.]
MPDATLPAEAITDPRTFADPHKLHGLLSRLRHEDPLPFVQADDHMPVHVVTRHADIVAVEKDAGHFINAPRQALLSNSQMMASMKATGGMDVKSLMRNLTAMDGPEHLAYREITQAYFTPKGMDALRADIEALAAEFVARLEDHDGECDFAHVAMSYPLRVIMTMLGVPQEDEPLMLRLTQQTLTSQDPEFQAQGGSSMGAMMEMYQYFQTMIADRRANPRDDLASLIANARIGGELLPERDVFGYFLIVATAGHDTTSYAITGGLLALLQHPGEMAKLRDNPALLPTAIEEILRWTTPVKHFCRTATEDRTVAGNTIKPGELMLLSYPSANRDEAAFDDADQFRIDRRPNRQLAFGTGPHVCLGQYLARLELTSIFREFLERVEHAELAGEPRYVESTFVGGVKYLPIRYRLR